METLFDHRRYDQEEEAREQTTHHDEGAQDAQDAILHVAAILEEPDHWEQDVGNEPRQEEGGEHAAQTIEQHDDAYRDDDPYQATHKRIEGNLVTIHNAFF